MTDTPATFPACRHAQFQSEPCACYAAGVAAERQRIRQLATEHGAVWPDEMDRDLGVGWHSFADLLDGGGQDTP